MRLNRTVVFTWKHVYNWARGVDNDNYRLRGDYEEEISDQGYLGVEENIKMKNKDKKIA